MSWLAAGEGQWAHSAPKGQTFWLVHVTAPIQKTKQPKTYILYLSLSPSKSSTTEEASDLTGPGT